MKNRLPVSNWGDVGENNQLSRANPIAQQQILRGAAEIRRGKNFCLSLPLDLPGGSLLDTRRSPPRSEPTYWDGDKPMMNFPLSKIDSDSVDVISDDQVLISLQYLTQWNWLAQVGALCADNCAVKAYPAVDATGKKSLLPLHHHCPFTLGLPLGELWYLPELAEWLAAHHRHHFMLPAPPLRLPGAVNSPVTPIATV